MVLPRSFFKRRPGGSRRREGPTIAQGPPPVGGLRHLQQKFPPGFHRQVRCTPLLSKRGLVNWGMMLLRGTASRRDKTRTISFLLSRLLFFSQRGSPGLTEPLGFSMVLACVVIFQPVRFLFCRHGIEPNSTVTRRTIARSKHDTYGPHHTSARCLQFSSRAGCVSHWCVCSCSAVPNVSRCTRTGLLIDWLATDNVPHQDQCCTRRCLSAN